MVEAKGHPETLDTNGIIYEYKVIAIVITMSYLTHYVVRSSSKVS